VIRPDSVAVPPPTRRVDVVDVVHGVAVPDPYRWLEADDDPEVLTWVAAQNARTEEALGALTGRSAWHERLAALIALPSSMGAEIAGDRLFSLERGADQEQYVLCVRDGASSVSVSVSGASAPRALVDPADRAADAAVSLDWFAPSNDGALVAFGLSEGGDERSVLHVIDVATGALLDDRIPDTRYASVAWLPDGRSFRYTRYPPGGDYEAVVYEHRLGGDYVDDPLVWDALPAPEAMVEVKVSPDGRWTLVSAFVGWSRGDVHLRDERSGEWTTIHAGVSAVTRIRFDGDRMLAVSTLDAPSGRVVAIDPAKPAPAQWTTLVAADDWVIESVTPLTDGMIVAGARDGSARLEHRDRDGALIGEIVLPEPMSMTGMDERVGPSAGAGDVVAIQLISFTRPSTLFRWHPGGVLEPWDVERSNTNAAYEPNAFAVRRRTYRSTDATEIGMFVMHRADVVPGPDTPCLLTGYGGFAISESPWFRPLYAAWCERGGIVAVANLRGGYEHGEAWHRAGMRANKQRVFDDFIAAAEHLAVEGLTSPATLAIYGGSNGGLLVGATMTQRPDLCRAVVCAVPLLDMIRFPQFLIARLWTDEYGDPDVAEEFGWLHAYSPYHHVVDGGPYPATLMLTAEGDSRVHPCHALKMAARLQHASSTQDDRPILLRVESRAGHGVGKPASKQAAEGADVLSFLSWQLGMAR
jgi:prolyl oligopeptidase